MSLNDTHTQTKTMGWFFSRRLYEV